MNKLTTLLFSITNMFVVLAISWGILYQSNFLYGLWYEHGGIAETIEHYSPKNINIQGFENTSKEERIRVFKAINYAVHIDKSTLPNITFSTPNNNKITLLTEPEIIHLIDVANMIYVLYCWLTFMILLWLYLLFTHIRRAHYYPSLLVQAVSIGSIFASIGVVIVIVGATEFFYWLHEVIFPDNHQWFFYYQESLMSTLMSAPDLFGWIALEWTLLFFVCFYLLHLLLKTLHLYLKIPASYSL